MKPNFSTTNDTSGLVEKRFCFWLVLKAVHRCLFWIVKFRTQIFLNFRLAYDSNPVLNLFYLKPKCRFLPCLSFDILKENPDVNYQSNSKTHLKVEANGFQSHLYFNVCLRFKARCPFFVLLKIQTQRQISFVWNQNVF